MYGYQIIRSLREGSGGFFDLKEGTLYPILYRMDRSGMLRSEWLQRDPAKPPRNYYFITDQGKRALAKATRDWKDLVRATETVLDGSSCVVDGRCEGDRKGGPGPAGADGSQQGACGNKSGPGPAVPGRIKTRRDDEYG